MSFLLTIGVVAAAIAATIAYATAGAATWTIAAGAAAGQIEGSNLSVSSYQGP